MAPAHPRRNETFPQLAAGFGVSTTTALRYVAETVEVLVA
ncbi:transposase family protein, partial [Streptomyces virginiae]